jgi:membrane-associated phospholipid phosphatase
VVLAHYPSDALGGAATGILSGWLAISIRNRYPEIENIFKGRERILSFIGVILTLILIWLLQGRDKLIILLEFYAPIVLIIAVVDRLQQSKQT